MKVSELIEELQNLPDHTAEIMLLFEKRFEYKARFKANAVFNATTTDGNIPVIVLDEESGLIIYPDFVKKIAEQVNSQP